MAHEIASAVYNRRPAWHGLGIVFEEEGKLFPDKALELADLNWEVEKLPMIVRDRRGGKEKKIPVPNHYAMLRTSDQKILGVVGSRYQPVQNHEAMSFLTDLVDSDDLEIEAAMALRGGSRVVIVARRPDHISIAGEDVLPYIIIATSHDTSMGVICMVTPVRVVCANTLQLALMGSEPKYYVKHTSGATLKVAEARSALQVSFNYTDEFKTVGEELALEKVTDQDFERFLNSLAPLPTEEEEARKGSKLRFHREQKQADIRAIWRTEDNLNNIRYTKWGVLNAVAEYETHIKNYKSGERRFEAHFTGETPDTKKAMKVLQAL